MKQKGQALIIGIIIGMLIAGGLFGAYYFGTLKNSKLEPANSVINPENQQVKNVPNPTQTSDDAVNSNVTEVDWQTYSKTQYGFEIKYQPYWETGGTERPDMVKYHILSWDFFNNMYPKNNPECLPYLRLTVYDSIERITESDMKFLGLLDTTKEVQGQPMKIYIAGPEYCGYAYTGIIELKNNNAFEISVGQIKDKAEVLDIFNQILSTFKFTN